MTTKGETVTVTCRHCGEPYSYVYAGGEQRAFHRPDTATGETRNCKVVYDNEVLRRARVAEANRAAEELAQVIEEARQHGRADAMQEAQATIKAAREEIDQAVSREIGDRLRRHYGSRYSSRAQKIVLSDHGYLLDLPPGEYRQLLARVVEAQVVGRGLLNQRQAQRQARATLATFREEMSRRFLPLLADIEGWLTE